MPAEWLAPTPTRRRTRTRWTVAGSLVLHLAAVTAILILPAFGDLAIPPISRRLAVVLAESVPVPPQLARTISVAPRVSGPPVEAPAGIAEEKPASPLTPPGVPGGYAIGDGRTSIHDLLSSGGPPVQTAPPGPVGPVRIGGDILPPQRIAYTAPIYPPIAREAKVDGTVVLDATIDAAGVVRDIRVVQSIPLLDRAAIDAVSRWRYTPTRLNGAAVSVILTVRVVFVLR